MAKKLLFVSLLCIIFFCEMTRPGLTLPPHLKDIAGIKSWDKARLKNSSITGPGCWHHTETNTI